MSVSLFSASAGVGPEQEAREFILRRVRLTFLVGMAVAAGLLAVGEVYSLLAASPRPVRSERLAYAAYLGLFAAGLASLLPGRPTTGRVRWTALAVTSGLLVTLAVDGLLHPPDYPPLAIVCLVLFGAAALIPWTLPFQVGLVGVSLIAVPAASAATGRWAGDLGWWSWSVAHPDPAAGAVLAAVGVALLGAVSAVITWTLYDLRSRAQAAERLGGYRLVRKLGSGGAGAVYLAEHARMCRPSAIKIVRTAGGGDPAVVERFQREIEVASRLDHPNTIEIRDYGRADDATFFCAMEYLPGLDLRELVRRFGPLEPARAVYVLVQVCDSLAEAHGKGIVHRDLKPANVFVTCRGGLCDFVKVLDFGLAKEVREADEDVITAAGSIVGTPEFIAPEAVDGVGRYGPRGDLYSLGCTAYWLLCGRPPFQGRSVPELMAAHLRRDPDPLETVSEVELPRELTRAVERCMEKEPDGRPESALELKAVLETIRFETPWTSARARAWWELHLSDLV